MADEVSATAAEERRGLDTDSNAILRLLDGIAAAHERTEGQIATIQKSLYNLEAHLLHKREKTCEDGFSGEGDDSIASPRSINSPQQSLSIRVPSKGLTGQGTSPTSTLAASLARALNDAPGELNDLWRVWAEEPLDFAQPCMSCALTPGSLAPRGRRMKVRWMGPDESGGERSGLGSYIAIRPNSRFRFFWDVTSLAILCYDIFLIPLSVFDVGVSGPFKWIDLAITLFWSVDVGVCFLSGFYKVGVVELRLGEIARKYMRGTFAFDICILTIDWVLTLSEFIDIAAIRLLRTGKLIRFGKAFRVLRLVRVLRLPNMLRDITDGIQSKTFQTACGIMKAVTYIAVINHYIACLWYQISTILYEDYGEPAWVQRLHDEGGRDDVYFYLTALHWSITQFTPASMEVQPRNSVERVYVIGVVFAALVVFSTFVSSITSAMTRLREYNKERFSQQESINNYLTEKKISYGLSCRIGNFMRDYKVLAKRRVREQDVSVFKALPTPLKLTLRFEAHGPILARMPFFYQLNEYDSQGFVNICFSTITELPVDLSREVFTPGQDAGDMYFLLDGHVEYSMQEDSQQFSAAEGDVVFCEAALWIQFQHPGRLVCKTSSEFLAMSSASLRGMVPYRPELHYCCCLYAEQFLGLLRDDDGKGMPVTEKFDLDVISFDKFQEIAQKSFDRAYWASPDTTQSHDERRKKFLQISTEHRRHEPSPGHLQVPPAHARPDPRRGTRKMKARS